MIALPGPVRAAIEAAARAAYPEECCGLLVGRFTGARTAAVDRAVPSPNVHADPSRGFEVDPRVRLAVMRGLGDGDQAIVGHYHSHPDHPAAPSARDLAAAYEPEMIWIIVAVSEPGVREMKAFALNPAGTHFDPIAISESPAP